jgi:hypothetical protein
MEEPMTTPDLIAGAIEAAYLAVTLAGGLWGFWETFFRRR